MRSLSSLEDEDFVNVLARYDIVMGGKKSSLNKRTRLRGWLEARAKKPQPAALPPEEEHDHGVRSVPGPAPDPAASVGD